ncbi:MAG: hypothetical protein IKY78_05500 [Clostridia bacterium]|nr:hypothetical protein [Clostridia bacterium]
MIISGVLLALIPDSKLDKSYKSFVALITMFMFITPFFKAKKDDTFVTLTSFSTEISKEELMYNDTSLVLNCAEDLLDQSIDDALKNAEINALCESCIKEKNGEAYISKVDIHGELTKEEEGKVISIINGIAGGVEIEFVG